MSESGLVLVRAACLGYLSFSFLLGAVALALRVPCDLLCSLLAYLVYIFLTFSGKFGGFEWMKPTLQLWLGSHFTLT